MTIRRALTWFAILASGVTASAQGISLNRIAFQFDNQQQSGGSSIVGNWHQTQQTADGGVVHTYWMFGADGSFRESSLQVGGGGNGTRTQVWGHYQAQPAQNGSLFVKTTLTGRAPLTMCMQGIGCRPTPTPPGTLQGYFTVRGNMFETTGVQAQRDQVPPALLQPLPATWNLQPPPPISTGGGSSVAGGSSSNRPKYHVPGQGGTCDDLQVSRVCTINDGYTYRDRNTGCLVCTK